MKLAEDDVNFDKGAEIVGGREGRFLEKPDIIDKFCRRDISDTQPELGELTAIQFCKMYDPLRNTKSNETDESPATDNQESGNPMQNA